MKKKFQPQNKEYEMSLLQKNDPEFEELKKYLKPYIEDALALFSMPKKIYGILYEKLMGDIPVAAKRFLENKSMDTDYKFSSYFGWYIGQRINNTDENVKRVVKK